MSDPLNTGHHYTRIEYMLVVFGGDQPVSEAAYGRTFGPRYGLELITSRDLYNPRSTFKFFTLCFFNSYNYIYIHMNKYSLIYFV